MISALLHDHAIPIVYLFQNSFAICDLIQAYPTYDTALKSMQKAFEGAYDRLFSKKLSEIYKEVSKEDLELTEQKRITLLNTLLSKTIQEELNRIKCPLEFDRSMLFDHGVLGAINLTTRLRSISDEFIDSDDAIKMAVNAIALHNSTTPHISKTKVRLDQEPIAFLLILCDEAQEWGREVGGREVGFQQRPTVECNHIEIGPFSYSNNHRLFEDDFIINFCLADKQTLDSTGWSADLFDKSKNLMVERLKFPDNDIRPKKLGWSSSFAPS